MRQENGQGSAAHRDQRAAREVSHQALAIKDTYVKKIDRRLQLIRTNVETDDMHVAKPQGKLVNQRTSS